MQYAIFATTILQDCWVKDSVCESLAAMAEYIHKNRWKLDQVTHRKSPGLQGDWCVYHYDPGKKLSELHLTDLELAELKLREEDLQ